MNEEMRITALSDEEAAEELDLVCTLGLGAPRKEHVYE